MTVTGYIFRLALIPVWQAAMVTAVLCVDSSPRRWLPGLFAVAAILIPFIGYLVVGYKIPVFRDRSRVLRVGFLTFLSVSVTICGYAGLFFVGLCVQGETGRGQLAFVGSGPCVCGVTNWSSFSPDQGGFSVLMPFPPTARCITNDTAAGPLVLSQFTAEPSRVVAFSVLQNRFPESMSTSNKQRLFEGGLKGALGADGRLLSDAEVKLHGYEGREWKIEQFKGRALITMRVYLVGHQLYQVVCVMPKRQACSRHIQQFLDSFDLKGGMRDGLGAEPQHAADGSQPFPSETNRAPVAAGFHR